MNDSICRVRKLFVLMASLILIFFTISCSNGAQFEELKISGAVAYVDNRSIVKTSIVDQSLILVTEVAGQRDTTIVEPWPYELFGDGCRNCNLTVRQQRFPQGSTVLLQIMQDKQLRAVVGRITRPNQFFNLIDKNQGPIKLESTGKIGAKTLEGRVLVNALVYLKDQSFDVQLGRKTSIQAVDGKWSFYLTSASVAPASDNDNGLSYEEPQFLAEWIMVSDGE